MKLTLAIVLAAACLAAAEDKVVMHIYDVSSLTLKITNFKGVPVGFDAMGVSNDGDMGAIGIGTSGGEEEGTAIPGEDLKIMISQNVAPGTWDAAQHSIDYRNGTIVVIHTQAVQDQVKKFLDVMRSRNLRNVVIEAEVFELAPGTLDAPAGTVLTDEQIKAVDAAAADPAKGRHLASLRACGLNTQHFNAAALSQETYLRDFDVEIAQNQAIADPVTGVLSAGFVLDVLPTISPDASLVLLQASFYSSEALPMRTFLPGGTYLGTLEEPDQAASRTRTSLVIPVGKSTLLSSAAYEGSANGWSQVVLVRATVAGEAPLPYPKSGKATETRLFDTRAVLFRPQDFPGPRLGGIHPGSQGDSGPSTTFIPPESEESLLVSPEALEVMIKQNVFPESWVEREGEVHISVTGNRELLVVQTPEALDQIEALLGRLMIERSRVVSVDAWVLALDPAVWRDRREALSGEIADGSWNELMAAAAKGTGARIAGTARGAGLNGERFHTARGVIRSLVMDCDVEIAQGASCLDPVVSSIAVGISLDVTPATVANSGQVQLDLRPTIVLGGEPVSFQMKEKAGLLQATTLSDFGVRTQMLVDAGKPALVGIATREDGGKSEVLLLFVKATVTDPK
ncbi:MAG: hypothetical protein K8T20_18825 [Planctomycetes bacterium]|nr:hypothetical protein [Planctomycetota bacterium]